MNHHTTPSPKYSDSMSELLCWPPNALLLEFHLNLNWQKTFAEMAFPQVTNYHSPPSLLFIPALLRYIAQDKIHPPVHCHRRRFVLWCNKLIFLPLSALPFQYLCCTLSFSAHVATIQRQCNCYIPSSSALLYFSARQTVSCLLGYVSAASSEPSVLIIGNINPKVRSFGVYCLVFGI